MYLGLRLHAHPGHGHELPFAVGEVVGGHCCGLLWCGSYGLVCFGIVPVEVGGCMWRLSEEIVLWR
jgi:hypothetical protein